MLLLWHFLEKLECVYIVYLTVFENQCTILKMVHAASISLPLFIYLFLMKPLSKQSASSCPFISAACMMAHTLWFACEITESTCVYLKVNALKNVSSLLY